MFTVQTTCHYSLLGLATDASNEEIAAAYARALARFKRRLAAGNPLPIEHLDALRDAHRTLSEPELRAAYDSERITETTPASDSFPTAAQMAASVAPALATKPRWTKAANTDDSADDASTPPTGTAVEFHGEGLEYLRIWVVNVALSIITLGIYSAWAKVRREKYFHRNLVVDGAAFDYHGNPRAILMGRILLVVLLGVMNFSEGVGPIVHGIVTIAAAFAFPWLLVRAMQFRARYTSYRGVRFSFVGTYREALLLYLLHGGLTIITLGLYFPAFLQRQKAFLANHLRFGGMACSFDAGIAAFYRGLKVPLILWLMLPASALILGAMSALKPSAGLAMMVVMLMVLVMLLLYLLLIPFVRVVGTNLLWNHTTLGETHFRSTQTVRSYVNLVVANWLLTILTLGFYWPIAQVKVARYRAEHVTVINPDALSQAIAAQQDNTAALGDEAIDAFDFDIAI